MLIVISLKFVPKGPVNNNLALAHEDLARLKQSQAINLKSLIAQGTP